MNSKQQFNKGGYIRRYLILVLLAALLTYPLAASPGKATPAESTLTKKASVKTAKTVSLSKPETAKVSSQTVANKPNIAAAPVQPAPKPQPQVVTTSYANGCSTYDSIFRQYAWNVSVAEAICEAESGGNPYAVSSTNDYGLMQLHDEEIFNPSQNIAAAYRKYLAQGWEAWTTYNTGAYQRFL